MKWPSGWQKEQYSNFRIIQDRDYESDFEKEIKKITARQRRGEKRQ